MHNRLYEFVMKMRIYVRNSLDSRLITLQSTQTLELVDSISNTFENGKFTQGFPIHFSKAFNTVDHRIFLNKK